jgi:transcriptional regulator with XRE-family HTH domain
MAEATTLGTWLRRERERRGVSLTDISDQTKLSVPLLQGLEADDLSRWPGGIFRRAFARSYATAIGVDPDLVVRRIEEEHPSSDAIAAPAPPQATAPRGGAVPTPAQLLTRRTPGLTLAVAALFDLLVAGAIGLGFAAAGSRLLWPVLAIAAYHAIGVLFTGRSPMLALLLDQTEPRVAAAPVAAEESTSEARADRAPTPAPAAARTPTGRFRQPGRRARGARGAQGARGA